MALLAVAVWAAMTGLFVLALLKRDNSIADIAWGPGFVLVALLSLDYQSGPTVRSWLATLLVAVWGIRLAVHVGARNLRSGVEDFRYAQWRRNWGKWFLPRSYLQVFLLQGFFLLVIASPVWHVNRTNHPGLTVLDAVGFAVWCLGFVFETVGDAQLERFKRDPANRGRIFTRGLWATTRHPNYFGEAVMWWGIFLLALNVPKGWQTIVGPVLITFLLIRVSGVPMLEKKYADNAEYREYKRRTPAFFPWFPRS